MVAGFGSDDVPLPLLGRYSPFLRRQEADLRVFHEDEELILDAHMDYGLIEGLSSEVRERLSRVRPTSLVSLYRQDTSEFALTLRAGCGKEDGRDDPHFSCFSTQVCQEDAWQA